MTNCKILAIDAGGTFFKYALLNEKAEFLSEIKKIPVNEKGTAEEIINSYKEIFDDFEDFSFIAISTPGPFDYENGISLMQHKFKSIYGVPLRESLEKLSRKRVCFLSDSNAFLLGESIGVYENSIGITIGTGLGFSAMQRGTLCTNENGGPCEKPYCLPYKGLTAEDYISGRGIELRYKKASGNPLNAKEIAELAENGDKAALKVYEDMGVAIGEILTPFVSKYETDILIIGGQVARSLNLFKKQISLNIPVVASLNVTGSALVGAVYHAKEYFNI